MPTQQLPTSGYDRSPSHGTCLSEHYRIQYHQDHIFPESRLTIDNLIEQGIKSERARVFVERADTLANLQLLTAKENESKQDTPFEEWITGQDESFYNRHLIPKDPEYHRIENFDHFLEQRADLIKLELTSILENSTDEGDQPTRAT